MLPSTLRQVEIAAEWAYGVFVSHPDPVASNAWLEQNWDRIDGLPPAFTDFRDKHCRNRYLSLPNIFDAAKARTIQNIEIGRYRTSVSGSSRRDCSKYQEQFKERAVVGRGGRHSCHPQGLAAQAADCEEGRGKARGRGQIGTGVGSCRMRCTWRGLPVEAHAFAKKSRAQAGSMASTALKSREGGIGASRCRPSVHGDGERAEKL